MTTAKPHPLSTGPNVFDGIYYPDADGIPLPDGFEQEPVFEQVTPVLRAYLEQYYDVIVSGDTFLYYEQGNPRAVVSPDCYVAFGVNRTAVRPYNSYFAWHVGKVPDFVLEIGSESTSREDTGWKRRLYASIGIAEYWRYDATQSSEHYGEPLVGERLENGEYVRIDVTPGPDGMPRGHSSALGLDLCWDDGRLRFYDPARDVWLEDYYEMREARVAAEDRLSEERVARITVEGHLSVERAARTEVEGRLAEEQAARQSAETRLAEMEAELRRLRGEG